MSEPGQAARVEHWGVLEEDLLYDQRRYEAYARAHHVSGHAWALWRLGEARGPVGEVHENLGACQWMARDRGCRR